MSNLYNHIEWEIEPDVDGLPPAIVTGEAVPVGSHTEETKQAVGGFLAIFDELAHSLPHALGQIKVFEARLEKPVDGDDLRRYTLQVVISSAKNAANEERAALQETSKQLYEEVYGPRPEGGSEESFAALIQALQQGGQLGNNVPANLGDEDDDGDDDLRVGMYL